MGRIFVAGLVIVMVGAFMVIGLASEAPNALAGVIVAVAAAILADRPVGAAFPLDEQAAANVRTSPAIAGMTHRRPCLMITLLTPLHGRRCRARDSDDSSPHR